ncbi:MAG: serine/threonine-protein phosphatase [Planctomycetes bacterium]|nr:serine/threonine-protein phosphatase [Planctomycetota bacterium]
MHKKTITIVGSPAAATSSSLVEQALALWGAKRPECVQLSLDDIINDESLLLGSGVVWVILEQEQTPGLFALLAMLQERHVPAMITHPTLDRPAGALFDEGVVAAPLDTPPAALAAILRTQWAQAGVLTSLRAELHMLQAHHGGLCEQIGKIDEELRLAAQIQREYLPPSLPEVGKVEFKVFFRPAGYVSGDIYDVIRLDEHHVGFFVADAVGHGVPAALMTMYIKRCLHTKEFDPSQPGGYRIVPPDEALERLNRDMVQQHGNGKVRFATACYGVLNCDTLQLSVARAGHPFPLLLHTDGTTETLSPDGGMLGIFPDEKYELQTVALHSGDRLLLYSDGFEVAFAEAHPLEGKARLANMQYAHEFKRLANGPLDDGLDELITCLNHQAGSLNQRDDLTVVCIGVKAHSRMGKNGGAHTGENLTDGSAAA